ncbi:MAG: 3'-5' exonuclease [Bacteroidales bacterium]|nr:3'-5' exonuclease [Bacteroidales bacterium]
MVDFINELNESQKRAVLHNDSASLVIAGAGSGKTRVLTYKIAWLLQNGFPAYTIMSLTFTNKAAREMKDRIGKIVGPREASRLWMGTFHSIFSKILRREATALGYSSNFTIYDSADSRSLIKDIIKELKLDEKIYKASTVQGRISSAKNSLVTPGMYAANKDLVESDMFAKIPLVRDIYKRYATRCKQADAMDFDDLLLNTNILFRDFPNVLEKYRAQFRFILVDEYQDTNFAQHLIVKQLSGGHGLVCAVGDDAQSIYSFRGANIDNILGFKKNFPGCQIFKLEQNYRSTQNIVDAANSLIKKNKEQIPKNVFSEKEKGEKIQAISAYSDFEEGYLVASKITDLRMRHHDSYNQFAILYRTNAQSRIMEEALRKRNIPYRIYGGLSFYQRAEIKDVVAYFRVIINPNDEEAIKRIINRPARGIGDTTINKLKECANLNNVSLWSVLQDPLRFALPVNSGTAKKLTGFRELMESYIEELPKSTAYQLAESVIKKSGLMTEMYADRTPENLSKQENIQELLSGIHEFCENKQEEGSDEIGLVHFLADISLATDQDTGNDEDQERVTMMTIHAAKGLEFNNVFVVGLEEDLFPSQWAKESERSLEEERRLFYVAITRAGVNCVLTFAKSRFRNGKTDMSSPSRFLNDIDSRFIDLPSENRLVDQVKERAQSFNRSAFGERATSFQSKPATQSFNASSKPVNPFANTPSRPAPTAAANTSGGNFSTHSVSEISDGTSIRHERFGNGTVLSQEGNGDEAKIKVQFDHSGERTLLLKYAKFIIEN